MFKIDELNRLYLGVQGENAARTIIIDVSEWLKTYPGGTVSIWSKRNGDIVNYTPNGLEFDTDEKTIRWTPDGVDTFYAGNGWCGIVLTDDGVIKKSKNIETFVTENAAAIPGADGNTFDYTRAVNKPEINGVELIGNQTLRDLGCFDDDNVELATKAVSAAKIKALLDTEREYVDNNKIAKPTGIAQGKYLITDLDGNETWDDIPQNSIDYTKLVKGTLDFVTPEMYGAVGNGITDDSAAIAAASAVGPVLCGDKTYYLANSITVTNSLIGGHFKLKKNQSIVVTKPYALILGCDFFWTELPDSSDRGEWALVVQNASGVVIEGCHFHDVTGCMYIGRSNNVIVNNNLFEDVPQTAAGAGGNGYGVLLVETNGVKIINNTFYNVGRHSIYISHESNPRTTYNKDVTISGNLFKWDENVVGNTTGFEVTMMIRPAKNVYIENNHFENMFNIATMNVQTILDEEGTETVAGTDGLYVRNNTGNFKFVTRNDGVLYFSGVSGSAACKNIYVEGNNFSVKDSSFIKADAIDTIYVIGNRVKLDASQGYDIFHGPEASHDAPTKNYYFINNVFECVKDGNMFICHAHSTTNGNHGDLVVKNNIIKNILYLGALQSSNNSFSNFIIDSNIIYYNSATTRNYFSDCAIDTICIRNNTTNKYVSLNIGLPTTVLSQDLAVWRSNTKPAEAIPGTLEYTGGEVFIKVPNDWVKIG